ncbi:adenylosuccinate lyase [Pseudoponticoccus marisrubri]|uniref:adenylosuccinate lyase n=1 Tax=Pseudoponticoccus marisrubri TaxID=1685382 RepID=UPI000BFEDE33|nr:adenylosuccinate lyase [Pseudoponticoccus marisrubri]
MTIKLLLAATALAVSPVLAIAQCSGHQQVMTCAEGTQYDPDKNDCIVVTG